MSIAKLWQLLKLVLQALKILKGEPSGLPELKNEKKGETDSGYSSAVDNITQRTDDLK